MVFPTTILTSNNRREDATSGHKPDETVSVGAASTLPGALAVLPRAAEPDVLMTHLEDRFYFSSETIMKSQWSLKQAVVDRRNRLHNCFSWDILEEKTEDFPSEMFSPGLLVVHDAPGGGQDDEPELSAGEKVVGPLLYVVDGHIEPGRDDPALVESSGQIDHDLASSVIIHHLELPDVSVFHHDGEEPHDNLTLDKVSSTFKTHTAEGGLVTLEQGLMRTCLLPLFSALLMHLRASASEFIRTMLICFNFSVRREVKHHLYPCGSNQQYNFHIQNTEIHGEITNCDTERVFLFGF